MKQNLSNIIHPDLVAAQQFAYEPSRLICNKLTREAESQEYGAFNFEINNKRIKFRVAKITPTKCGLFVTLWKRIGTGPILPYDMADPIDLFIVSVRSAEHFGQFVFPKNVLCEKNITAKEGKGGKRAMRVYPPWVITDNRQAQKTQTWQILYFFEIPAANQCVDTNRVRELFR